MYGGSLRNPKSCRPLQHFRGAKAEGISRHPVRGFWRPPWAGSLQCSQEHGCSWHFFQRVFPLSQGGLSSTAYVKVFLEDVNDNAPAFYPLEYAASISTQSQPGSAVLRVTAQDKDEGLHGRVTYRIANGNMLTVFAINPDTGTA